MIDGEMNPPAEPMEGEVAAPETTEPTETPAEEGQA